MGEERLVKLEAKTEDHLRQFSVLGVSEAVGWAPSFVFLSTTLLPRRSLDLTAARLAGWVRVMVEMKR